MQTIAKNVRQMTKPGLGMLTLVIDLSKRQPGEQVVFRFTEMVAVQVEES